MGKIFILRADDICASTRLDDLCRIYAPVWAQGWPVCLSVIPHAAYEFTAGGIVPISSRPITDHPALVDFLAAQLRAGLVEITLHGWQHHYGELAGNAADTMRQRLESGLALLREAWPEASIRVLVPPHDDLSAAGVQAARSLNLQICSTYAATRGGARWVHWQGRLRRWLGVPSTPRDGLWPTDITLLDFNGDSAYDWPETLALFRRGDLIGRPQNGKCKDYSIIFTQHYWHILANADRRHRWQNWLTRIKAETNVEFRRFADFLDHHHHT